MILRLLGHYIKRSYHQLLLVCVYGAIGIRISRNFAKDVGRLIRQNVHLLCRYLMHIYLFIALKVSYCTTLKLSIQAVSLVLSV